MNTNKVTIKYITLDSGLNKIENAVEDAREMLTRLHQKVLYLRINQNAINRHGMDESFEERLYALNEFIEGVNSEIRYLMLVDIPRLEKSMYQEPTVQLKLRKG
jgi:hypothetical protein